ncbi:mannose-6-phosphate isomerase, class I [Oerskovia turbata]|uniref:mannose-6-phosphate isomerase n=1 Tax=Oerskovia turbata TaxID=1713 RepID=A0A4Q1L1W4_9CELL|nr:mannose-6-phosphate isomerase, class I [Oerskovia turbata]RXR26915.1 mannose-6-phosphate isomerase, class I [Oerskovia turbata]RXR36243.1 mannose-6-phosphate isomerase, class I [Oerskovia turbata]TGJ97920.1 mannose-6-phosphate isomerase, class I [Actinotalea fermentans ATCC 43279 = JCM 9966 = DSM 3133]
MSLSILRLTPTLQSYDWGSRSALHTLLGLEQDGEPLAEMWMGAHPKGPSSASVDGGPSASLADLIRNDPVRMLGQRVLDDYGPRLPYLLKVLAADRALSLQVHPQPHRARAGFNRENREGVPRDSPERSFHDDQHKPEMVVAVSRFEGLSGFRRPVRILELLGGLRGDLAAGMRAALEAQPSAAGLREAFTLALHARTSPDVAADLASTVADVRARLGAGTTSPRADATVLALAEQHPGDPGAVVSLMLNRVTLEPGESMFVPAGHVHAYLSGCAVEIMSSSDNVLRAGLTSKRVDVESLLACVTYAPGPAARPQIRRLGVLPAAARHGSFAGGEGLREYRAAIPEFALVMGEVDSDAAFLSLPAEGPRIVLVLDGQVELECGAAGSVLAGESLRVAVRSGRAVFVPHAAGPLSLHGSGRAVIAYVP